MSRNRNSTVLWTAFRGLLAGALSMGAAAQSLPRGYEIVDVTSGNGLLENFVRMNNNGQVVWGARLFPENIEAEIWMYDARTGELTQITDDAVYDGYPDINDEGAIVWSRWIGEASTPEIMMRTPDGVVAQITDDPAEDWAPRINNAGQIVWTRFGPAVCRGLASMDIYTYDGAVVSRLTDSGETFGYANQSPEINDLGEIVWTEYSFCNPPPGHPFESRIMLYSDGLTSAVSTTVEAEAPDINNLTQIVWDEYNPVAQNYRIHFWESGNATLLTDHGINAAVNDQGQVAFTREVGGPIAEVFLWEAGEFRQITLDAFDDLNPAINNHGEIAWSYGTDRLTLDVEMMRRFCVGDLNCDGSIDAFDIEGFALAIVDPKTYEVAYPSCDPVLGDVNADGVVDAFDIGPFIGLLIQ